MNWHLDLTGIARVIREDGTEVVSAMDSSPHPDLLADFKLIGAATEMRAVCRDALTFLESEDLQTGEFSYDEWIALVDRLRALLS